MLSTTTTPVVSVRWISFPISQERNHTRSINHRHVELKKTIPSILNQTRICQLISHYIPTIHYVIAPPSSSSSLIHEINHLNITMDQNPPLTIVHYCGEWNEMDSMFFSSFEKLRLTSDVILLLLDCYQSHPSLETIQVEYLNNLIDNNTFLMIGCVSSDENQFSKCEESYLTSFICDPSNAFLTYFTKQFENNKLNGYLFLTQSNNNQLFEILMQHFENLIEEYIQNNHFEIWIRHNNLKRLLKHLLLSLILLSKLQQGRPSNSLLMRPQERTWLNQLCQSKQHDSMWNNLFEKMNHFLEQVEWNHQERIQKFNSLLNSSQPTTTTRTTTTSSNRFRVSKL